MDALVAEIAAKKAALGASAQASGSSSGGSGSSSAAGPSKYMRRAEIEAAEKLKKEEAARAKRELAKETLRKEREAREAKRLGKVASASPAPDAASVPSGTDVAADGERTGTAPPAGEAILPPAEISRRLRARGKPIRFFGETDKDRFGRLRALELADGDGRRAGGRVDEFRSMLKGVEDEMLLRDSERGKAKRRKVDEGVAVEGGAGRQEGGGKDGDGAAAAEMGGAGDAARSGEIDLELLKSDISKLHPQVFWFYKNLLKEWDDWLDTRPEDVKRSMDGKLASANWMQSSANMKPLFKSLRTRTIPLDVLAKLAEIGREVSDRQYQRANDAYLRLSIGNAAWPIGVTSVGMHERGARERITEDVVAHVLNDEVSRKWIQAVKRLITFSQTVRPPAERAQRMG